MRLSSKIAIFLLACVSSIASAFTDPKMSTLGSQVASPFSSYTFSFSNAHCIQEVITGSKTWQIGGLMSCTPNTVTVTIMTNGATCEFQKDIVVTLDSNGNISFPVRNFPIQMSGKGCPSPVPANLVIKGSAPNYMFSVF
jgi:hypothetical protein